MFCHADIKITQFHHDKKLFSRLFGFPKSKRGILGTNTLLRKMYEITKQNLEIVFNINYLSFTTDLSTD